MIKDSDRPIHMMSVKGKPTLKKSENLYPPADKINKFV